MFRLVLQQKATVLLTQVAFLQYGYGWETLTHLVQGKPEMPQITRFGSGSPSSVTPVC
jgi:hypothetical protein